MEIPTHFFSAKAQISILQKGETSALANALLGRADGRWKDSDNRQNAKATSTHLETLEQTVIR